MRRRILASESQQFLSTWKANPTTMNLGPKPMSYSHIRHVNPTSMTKQDECKQTNTKLEQKNSHSPVWKRKKTQNGVKDSVPDGKERVGSDSPWESAFSPLWQQQPKKVTSLQLTRFMALHEMTWNNNTVADVVNDPVNPNNGGESLSPCPSLPLLSTFVPSSPPFYPVGRRRLCMKRKKEKTNSCFRVSCRWHSSIVNSPPQPHASYPLDYIPLTSQPPTPVPTLTRTLPFFIHSPGLRRSRGTGRSSLCASLGGCLRACGLSCASAWLTGWGSTPGRWCIGRAKRRCGCAGAWSWPSSPWIAGGTACTRMASHLRMIGWGWRQHLC